MGPEWKELLSLDHDDNGSGDRAAEAASIALRQETADRWLGDIKAWELQLINMRRERGDDGAWEIFRLIQERKQGSILAQPQAQSLRDEIVAAALGTNSRIAEVVDVARTLSFNKGAPWPHLYFDVIHHLLRNDQHDDAVLWHFRLAPHFPPETEDFGTLLEHFAVDPTRKMQDSLETMYIFGTERRMYDHIIPVLFESGHSNHALRWRKTLLGCADFPSTPRSLPFLQFCRRYYPNAPLVHHETSLLPASNQSDSPTALEAKSRPNRTHTDSMVAKWFASSWTSVDFAVNLVHRLGFRSIGPRSLQSLALRETGAKGVAGRIAQLQHLGIALPGKLYDKAIVSFAEQGDDALLTQLLQCDVHPDEFQDAETRELLLTAAVRNGNTEMKELLQAMDDITKKATPAHTLHATLADELKNGGFFKAKAVLERMEALDVVPNQHIASQILRMSYSGAVRDFRRVLQRPLPIEGLEPSLDRAIDTTVQLARQGVAIRVRDWVLLLHNLGWAGRLSELEQLSMEIVDLFDPQYGGLIAVHQADVPDCVPVGGLPEEPVAGTSDESVGGMSEEERRKRRRNRAERREYIPADLPFTHCDHPVQQIFNIRLQKRMVMWGFDQTLQKVPLMESSLVDLPSAKPEHFDAARGVRLLAMLRDRGVPIDTHAVVASLPKRLVLAQLPSRSHYRRDEHTLSTEPMKRLIEQAWGSKMLPELPVLNEKVRKERYRAWRKHHDWFGKNFDDEFVHTRQRERRVAEKPDNCDSEAKAEMTRLDERFLETLKKARK